jgi:hypothetical protein
VTNKVEPIDWTDHIEAMAAKLIGRHFPAKHGAMVVERIPRGGQGRST